MSIYVSVIEWREKLSAAVAAMGYDHWEAGRLMAEVLEDMEALADAAEQNLADFEEWAEGEGLK